MYVYYSEHQKQVFRFVFTRIIYAALSTFLAFVSYKYFVTDIDSFDDVINNWRSHAVLNIAVSSNDCPEGYENINSYTWPGTSTGCWCGNVSLSWKESYGISVDLSKGTCNENQLNAGCSNVDSTNAKELTKWTEITEKAKNLCVQRSEAVRDELLDQPKKKCPKLSKKCGLTSDTTFCTEEEDCPIVDINSEMLLLPRDSEALADCEVSYDCQVVDQDAKSARILKFRRSDTYDGFPISQLSLNEYSMCKDVTKENITPGRNVFLLENNPRSTCGSEAEELWNISGYSVTESRLFELNGLTQDIEYLSQFGYYDEGKSGDDYSYSLFTRRYIPITRACRYWMSYVLTLKTDLQMLRDMHLGLLMVMTLINLAVNICVPFYYLRDLLDQDKKDTQKWVIIINSIAKVAQLPMQMYTLIFTISENFFFTSIESIHCFPDLIAQNSEDVAWGVYIAYSCDWFNFIILGAYFVSNYWYYKQENSNMLRSGFSDRKWSELVEVNKYQLFD